MSDPAIQNEQHRRHELSEQLNLLSSVRGQGTSMITLYIAQSSLGNTALGRARSRLNDELGTATQIKSRV